MTNKPTSQAPLLIEVSPHVKDSGLNEIYQTMQNKMALLRREGDKFIRITPYVLCRDFLVDVFSFGKLGVPIDIYEMKFDPSKEALPTELCLSVRFPNAKVAGTFQQNLLNLHAIELANGWDVTTVSMVDDKEAVIQADHRWLGSCLLWSLYTSLIRVLCYELEGDWLEAIRKQAKGGPDKQTDAYLVKSVDPDLMTSILVDLSQLNVEPWCGLTPNTDDPYNVHHNTGFYSVFGTHRELSVQTIHQNVHWQKFKEMGWALHTK